MSQSQPNLPNDASLSHTRVIDTVLGKAEKRALLWLAAHMPAWVTPDTLTLIGLSASVVIFISYALTSLNPAFLWLASLGYVINWFGDSLDGSLARYRHIERPRYGFFVDHIIDSISEVLVFIGLGLSPYLNFNLALLALIGYLLMATYVYLVTYVNGVFNISFGHLGPTESRLLAILANTLVFFLGNRTFQLPQLPVLGALPLLTLYDGVAVLFIVLVIVFFSVNSFNMAMKLSEADRAAARIRSREEKAIRTARRQMVREERQKLREERALRKSQTREKASAASITQPLTNRT